ncbi:hypothetical protein ELG79_22135 [Rhizobium leguminosarum]|uniref:hypothetical protein n=1 Tax=Rhizobium leguminosarum TaxID=384 RepID=UPI00103099DC|nr:hypothetical protein [Rhizobium leguminosarum]TBG27789.1 hypothetical protein ELG79_22135 [Rhizobium leguminosarum]
MNYPSSGLSTAPSTGRARSTFDQVLLLAEQYGWSRTEAAAAIQELAFNRLAQEEENRLVTLTIDQLSHSKH